MKTPAIKEPCPFCGSNELSYSTSTEDREGIPTHIFCEDCGCSGPWIYLEFSELKIDSYEEIDGEWIKRLPKRALEIWNKRK